MSNQKKTCFVITPIGEENSEIRRHVDGVIDEIITPVMESDYDIEVAHRLFQSGSINKQIIELIYVSDLVIANLTQLNPNVMYELAFRHTLGLPAITIAVDGTKLPFDVISERTIFYKNDIQGVREAKEELKKYLSQIDYSNGKTTGPIHDYLDSVELSNLISSHNQNQSPNISEVLDLIVKRLEGIENAIPNITRDITLELSSSSIQSNNQLRNLLQTVLECIQEINVTINKELTSTAVLYGIQIKNIQKDLESCQIIIKQAIKLL